MLKSVLQRSLSSTGHLILAGLASPISAEPKKIQLTCRVPGETPHLTRRTMSSEQKKAKIDYGQYNDPHDLRMIWVDCEMTGLNVTVDHLIEIAVLITDKDLNLLATGPNLVIHQSKDVMDGMNEWCVNQHGASGLTQRVLDSKISVKDAEKQVLDFVQAWTPAGKCVLAGNSVGEDKKFIEKHMPEFYRHLHYRIIDVSTIKELAKRWKPDLHASKPPKKCSHLAMDDILESVEELKHYQKAMFK